MPKLTMMLLCYLCLGVCLLPTNSVAQVAVQQSDEDLSTSSSSRRTTIKFGPLFSSSGIAVGINYMVQRSDYVGFGGELDFSKYALSGPYSFMTLTANYRVFPFAADGLFICGRVGYGHPVSSAPRNAETFTSDGGLALAGAIGYRFGSRVPSLEVSFGARSQAASFVVEEFGTLLIEDSVYKRMELSIGMSF